MASLFDFLLKLFARIFWGSEEEWYKHKQRKAIIKSLRERHPDWLDSSGKRLGEGFASAMLKLARSVHSFAGEFSRLSAFGRDEQATEKIAGALFRSWMDDEAVALLESLSYEKMKAEVSSSLDPFAVLERLDLRFESLFTLLSGDHFSGFSDGFFHLLLFAELLRYDFQGLLVQFDPSFSILNPRYVSAFSPIALAQVEEELLDFYYIWEEFEVSISFERDISILSGDEASDTLEQRLYHLREARERGFSAEELLLLLQIAKEDAAFQPSTYPKPENSQLHEIQRIKEKFLQDRFRLEKSVKEKKLRPIAEKLFLGIPYRPLKEYGVGIDRLLLAAGFVGFRYVLPLETVMNFLEAIYRPSISRELAKLLDEGFFPDPTLGQRLVRIMSDAEGLETNLKAFCTFAGDVPIGDRTIGDKEATSLLQSDEISAEDRTALEEYQKILDKEAAELVKQSGALFGKLYRFVMLLNRDAKQRQPGIVTNIRAIEGVEKRNIQERFRDIEESLDLLVAILKRYTVVVSPSEYEALSV
ncbi:hypothetical protein [Sediminispirochaeta smaragdinae]|uniref:Uncharacterized protein n=1 Tax=Sediminispirochaeta smaragdinae (strain DSM 11293 / JCM 15392 / SEBR 4228) TaxID=573413 RepID=E1R8L5_SEDSS|nr:hypothetical protein [Sediminispirochaeta smaragdinae]ADK81772.1 hypothetical protein Spirs_2665 [Sediminispirochaeta smaragdinae DSM 11293]